MTAIQASRALSIAKRVARTVESAGAQHGSLPHRCEREVLPPLGAEHAPLHGALAHLALQSRTEGAPAWSAAVLTTVADRRGCAHVECATPEALRREVVTRARADKARPRRWFSAILRTNVESALARRVTAEERGRALVASIVLAETLYQADDRAFPVPGATVAALWQQAAPPHSSARVLESLEWQGPRGAPSLRERDLRDLARCLALAIYAATDADTTTKRLRMAEEVALRTGARWDPVDRALDDFKPRRSPKWLRGWVARVAVDPEARDFEPLRRAVRSIAQVLWYPTEAGEGPVSGGDEHDATNASARSPEVTPGLVGAGAAYSFLRRVENTPSATVDDVAAWMREVIEGAHAELRAATPGSYDRSEVERAFREEVTRFVGAERRFPHRRAVYVALERVFGARRPRVALRVAAAVALAAAVIAVVWSGGLPSPYREFTEDEAMAIGAATLSLPSITPDAAAFSGDALAGAALEVVAAYGASREADALGGGGLVGDVAARRAHTRSALDRMVSVRSGLDPCRRAVFAVGRYTVRARLAARFAEHEAGLRAHEAWGADLATCAEASAHPRWLPELETRLEALSRAVGAEEADRRAAEVLGWLSAPATTSRGPRADPLDGLERALARTADALPADRIATARAWLTAETYLYEAVEVFRAEAAASAESRGVDARETLELELDQADTLTRLSLFVPALRISESVLRRAERGRARGAVDAELFARAVASYADALSGFGRCEVALAYRRKQDELMRALVAVRPAWAVRARFKLAIAMDCLASESDEVWRLQREAIDLSLRELGPVSRDSGDLLDAFAFKARVSQQSEFGDALHARAIAIREHPMGGRFRLSQTLGNQVISRTKRPVTATAASELVDQAQQAYGIRRDVLGDAHSGLGFPARAIAEVLKARGLRREATRGVAEWLHRSWDITARNAEAFSEEVDALGATRWLRRAQNNVIDQLLASPADELTDGERFDLVLRWQGFGTRSAMLNNDLIHVAARAPAEFDEYQRQREAQLLYTLACSRPPGARLLPCTDHRAAEAAARVARAEQALVAVAPAFAHRRRLEPVSLQDLCAAMKSSGESLVSFFEYEVEPRERRLTAFVVNGSPPSRCQVEAVRLEASTSSRAMAFHRTLARLATCLDARRAIDCAGAARDHRDAGRALGESLWPPIEARLRGAQRVVVVADGALLGAPIAALPLRGGRYVGDDHRLRYEAAPALVRARAPTPRPGRLLLVHDPAFTGQPEPRLACPEPTAPLPPQLLASKTFDACPYRTPVLARRLEPDEACGVRGRAERAGVALDELRGLDASRTAILRALAAADVAHVSTHAFATPQAAPCRRSARSGRFPRLDPLDLAPPVEDPLEHVGLLLTGAAAPTPSEDAFLSARDVAHLDLSGLRLAVLSACSTHVGEPWPAEGQLSFAWTLRAAGTTTVMASLWPVPERHTAELMQAFYEGWLDRGLSAADALSAAQRKLRRALADDPLGPYLWGGFVVLGDG